MVFLNIASGSGNWCNDFENNLVRCTLKMSLLSITAFLGIIQSCTQRFIYKHVHSGIFKNNEKETTLYPNSRDAAVEIMTHAYNSILNCHNS